MSYQAAFYFNIPKRFTLGQFTQALSDDLAIRLSHKNEYGVYTGVFLGLLLHFDPNHELENDQGIEFNRYRSSIGISSSAGDGCIRIIQLQQVINIALAIVSQYKIEGIVVKEAQEHILHIAYNNERSCLWDMGEGKPIHSYEALERTLPHGVSFSA